MTWRCGRLPQRAHDVAERSNGAAGTSMRLRRRLLRCKLRAPHARCACDVTRHHHTVPRRALSSPSALHYPGSSSSIAITDTAPLPCGHLCGQFAGQSCDCVNTECLILCEHGVLCLNWAASVLAAELRGGHVCRHGAGLRSGTSTLVFARDRTPPGSKRCCRWTLSRPATPVSHAASTGRAPGDTTQQSGGNHKASATLCKSARPRTPHPSHT
eukprot:363474-Chlamydomonas_euryale.AAC.2